MSTHLHLWRPPADLLALETGEVHLWRASLDVPAGAVDRLADTLTDEEWERAQRYRCLGARKQFILARGLLRTLLAAYLECQPAHVQFRHGPQGKPALDPTPDGPLYFNVSHSNGMALLAFTRHTEVGVDVEHLRPFASDMGMAKRYFSRREYQALRSLDAEQRTEHFFHTWTRKEAILKARGVGLAHGLERVEVAVGPHEPVRILRMDEDECWAARWSLRALTPAPGYVGALALEGHDHRLVCWDWSEDLLRTTPTVRPYRAAAGE
jgi:4'-phosphopantetheinyl transferase